MCVLCGALWTEQHWTEVAADERSEAPDGTIALEVHVDRRTRHGESWQWHEFTVTAYHLPGQTLYHGGLLIEGRGHRILFCGDSFTMAGIDDYCAGNRNWLGSTSAASELIAAGWTSKISNIWLGTHFLQLIGITAMLFPIRQVRIILLY